MYINDRQMNTLELLIAGLAFGIIFAVLVVAELIKTIVLLPTLGICGAGLILKTRTPLRMPQQGR